MHCFICDREDDQITFDKVREEFTPCVTCQEAIQECLGEFGEEGEEEDGESLG